MLVRLLAQLIMLVRLLARLAAGPAFVLDKVSRARVVGGVVRNWTAGSCTVQRLSMLRPVGRERR
jgi:hypothetical protein